jgi:hypothetical protein
MTCCFCAANKTGRSFQDWVKPTFTDFDKLLPGDVICDDCLFWFDESSVELAEKVGKDKPQRMRNYSHFIVDREWIPLSKGQKKEMASLLLIQPFPELAAIAESGQKHIVFRARRNSSVEAGWVQFEEQSIWVTPQRLKSIIDTIQSLMIVFSKSEIELEAYRPYRIMNFGIQQWQDLEQKIKDCRGSSLFKLSLFLSQKLEENDNA